MSGSELATEIRRAIDLLNDDIEMNLSQPTETSDHNGDIENNSYMTAPLSDEEDTIYHEHFRDSDSAMTYIPVLESITESTLESTPQAALAHQQPVHGMTARSQNSA